MIFHDSFTTNNGCTIILVFTVFENQRKSLIQHCERSELTFFSEQKFIKTGQFGKFLKIKACGQTVLPDMSILIEQKSLVNAKKYNETFLRISL